MIKLLIRFWPLLLPLLLFGLWWLYMRRKHGKEALEEGPLAERKRKLFMVALVTTLLGAVVLAFGFWFYTDANAPTRYAPATYQDGVLVPGHVISDESAQ